MISRINIKNTATYLEEVEVLPTKINYFYGSNGSGKTSLTNVLKDIVAHNECRLEWKNHESEVLVYNRDFVKDNFLQSDKIKGIFTLGKDSKEAKEFIEKTTKEIAELRIQIIGQTNTLGAKEVERDGLKSTFREACWQKKDKYTEHFRDAYSGFLGSKDNFAKKCLDELKNTSSLLTIDEIKKKCDKIFKGSAITYDSINTIDISELSKFDSHPLLNTKIIGKEDVEIGKLISFLENSDWIKEGLGFLEKSKPKCPFCQQQVNDDLKDKIEEFFDVTYEEKCEEIKKFARAYHDYYNAQLTILNEINARRIDILDYSELSLKIQLLEQKFKSNIILLSNKVKSPSTTIKLDDLGDLLKDAASIVNAFKNEINKHNQTVSNLDKEKKQLISEIWRFIVEELATEINNFNSKLNGISKAEGNLNTAKIAKENEVNQKLKELRDKEEEITSVTHTVNEINRILNLFGFNSFKLSEAPEKGCYKIVRENGEDAKETLSEGEYTFITFLYFYQLLKGSNESSGVSKDRIVVIDDPISSLDSNVLFVVSHLVKEVIKDCKSGNNGIQQVFVLTHNVYFYKEVTYKGSRESKSKDETFWIVKKLNGRSSVINHPNNPIQTTYEMLWRELDDLNSINKITVFNTLRRILEYYFKIIGGLDYEKCINEFEGEDKLVCKALVSWINDGSHFVNDDIVVDAESEIIEKYLVIFKDIFQKLGHISHYNMMMKIDASLVLPPSSTAELNLSGVINNQN